jgi:hypothetical protein
MSEELGSSTAISVSIRYVMPSEGRSQTRLVAKYGLS